MNRPAPILVNLEDARHMLAGKDPREFGIPPVTGAGRGMVFHVDAIRRRLDELAGIAPTASPAGGENDNDEDADFAEIDRALGISGNA